MKFGTDLNSNCMLVISVRPCQAFRSNGDVQIVDALIAPYQIKFPKSFQFDIDRKTRIKELRYEIEKEVLAIEDWQEEHEEKKEILDHKLKEYPE